MNHDCGHFLLPGDLIMNKSDQQALVIAPKTLSSAPFRVTKPKRQSQHRDVRRIPCSHTGDNNSEYAYRHMADALRRLSGMPANANWFSSRPDSSSPRFSPKR